MRRGDQRLRRGLRKGGKRELSRREVRIEEQGKVCLFVEAVYISANL